MTTTYPGLMLPGTPGFSHGAGFMGDAIRYVEEHNSKSERFPNGDHEAAWAGHVFVFVGDGMIVEAEWPKVKLSPVSAHADAVWATGLTLTEEQRVIGVKAVMATVGMQYNALAYAYFLAKLAQIQTGVSNDFVELEKHAAEAGPICSGIMVRELLAINYDIGPLRTAAIQSPDFISPADGLRWCLDGGTSGISWIGGKVPAW